MTHITTSSFVGSWLRIAAGSCVFTLGLIAFGVTGAIGGEESAVKEKVAVEGVIQRGAAIGSSPSVRLAEVLADPGRFENKSVIFVGTIAEVCQTKGCWMKVLPDSGAVGVRVTFKDYGFFVPKDSKGMWVRAEGVFHVKSWSKEEADHLEGEGARLVRKPDGSATELGFVASGVELKPGETPKPVSKADSAR